MDTLNIIDDLYHYTDLNKIPVILKEIFEIEIDKAYFKGNILFVEMQEAKFALGLYDLPNLSEQLETRSKLSMIKENKIKNWNNKFINEIEHSLSINSEANYIIKKLSYKKRQELLGLSQNYPIRKDDTFLSFSESIKYFKTINIENNGEWDFQTDDGMLVEYANVTQAGSQIPKIKRETNFKGIPITTNEEIFNELKMVLKRKLIKKSSNKNINFHRIVIVTSMYSTGWPWLFSILSHKGEFASPESIINYLKEWSSRNYCGFQYGELVLIVGELKSEAIVLKIKDFILEIESKKIYLDKNSNIFNVEISFESDDEGVLENFKNRIKKYY